MFYLNSTLNFGISPGLVFQLEVYGQVGSLSNWFNCSTKRNNLNKAFLSNMEKKFAKNEMTESKAKGLTF